MSEFMEKYENNINYSLLSDWHLFWLHDQSAKVEKEMLRRMRANEKEFMDSLKEYKEMRKINDNK